VDRLHRANGCTITPKAAGVKAPSSYRKRSSLHRVYAGPYPSPNRTRWDWIYHAGEQLIGSHLYISCPEGDACHNLFVSSTRQEELRTATAPHFYSLIASGRRPRQGGGRARGKTRLTLFHTRKKITFVLFPRKKIGTVHACGRGRPLVFRCIIINER